MTEAIAEIEDPPALDSYKRDEQRRFDATAPVVDGSPEAIGPTGLETLNPALRAPYRFVEDWLATHAPGRLLMDFGSGQGVHSIAPANCGAEVVGLDISPRSSEVAGRRAERHGVADLCRFVVGDCERLPFPDAHFDLAISMGTFSCLRFERGLSELARVVRPDGHVVITDTLGHNPLLNLNRRMNLWRKRRTRWQVDHVLKLSDLERLRPRFRRAEFRFFDVTTPLIAPFCRGEGPIARAAILAAQGLDERIVRLGPLRGLAFKFVAILSGPLPTRGDEGSEGMR